MPHSFIDDIIRDSDGYIWVATHYGIGRYDGYQFLNYNTTTPSFRLKSDFANKLCEDNFKRLWIATESGIDLLDLKTYTRASLSLPPDSLLHRLMDEYICTLYKDRSGDLWIAGNKDLWCIELDEKGDISAYYCLKDQCQSPVHALIDLGWGICAGINNEVCLIEKRPGNVLTYRKLSEGLPPFSPDWRILCMQADNDVLWIGTNRGLFKYNPAAQSLQRYRYSTHRPGMLSQAYITDIKLTDRGHLIVSTLNGINVYHRDTDSFSFIRQANNRSGIALNCSAIRCIYTEGETIWLGTESGGIDLLSPKRLQTETWNFSPIVAQTNEEVVPINAICEDTSGNLWVSLIEKGLMKWNRKEAACTRYLFSPNDLTTLSNNTLNGLLIDSEQCLWAYTWGVGINKLDLKVPDNRRIRRYTREEFPSLEGDFISSACEDRFNHGIWFGSTRGMMFYDRQKDDFIRVQFDGHNNEFDGIHSLLVDRKNRLWIGSTQGVFIIDLASFAKSHRNFSYNYLRHKLNHPESAQIEKINTILEDKNGNIWLGGNGSGLYKLTDTPNTHFTFENYTVRNGLPNNTITGMTEDAEGDLWLMTNEGISRLNTLTMTFTNYTHTDGLPATQYYRNGIYYSPQRNLIYLATTAGLVVVHPSNDLPFLSNPTVKFSTLTIAGKPILSSEREYLTQNITSASQISIHEKESRFTIGFTTQDYGNSDRIRYAYRLKGYEKEWNETQPGDRVARYTAVPPGNYILQVHATDESGHWSSQTTELSVHILPYFYKTTWFYLLLSAMLCLSIWVFYRWKTQRYREQRIHLEREVELRTQELAAQNEELERMAQHVKEVTEEKIAFFTNITHEFRTPVTLIHGPIEHALKEIDDNNVKEQLQIAERNSRDLLSLVNELMDFRKLDMDKVTLNLQPHPFADFLQELLLPFRVFARERRIEINTYFRLDTPCLMIDSAYMRKAIINLVSNAIKFTPDGERIDLFVASIRGNDGERLLYINVYDTGSGIIEEDREKIFDRFFQSRKSTKYPVYGQSGTGIGLFLCRRIIELHGGTIHARNNHHRGASFRILMPLIPGEMQPGEEKQPEPPMTGKETIAPPTTGAQRKETVLIVEDNTDMRHYLRTLLEKEYRLLEADNGETAIHIVEKQSIDLIVSDLMMPVMDGMELSRRLKENFSTSHIPFLMLTALRSDVQEKKSFEIGVDEYLCKPFDEEVLLLRIRNILNLRNKYRQMFSVSSEVEALHIKEQSKDQAFVSNAIELMKKNYVNPEYGLDNFVRDMGYSKTLVNRKMQDLTGQSIGQFIKNYRLNIAKRMIQENTDDVNVSEIAYAVGFNDPKYFTRCFKELFGYLPSSRLKRQE